MSAFVGLVVGLLLIFYLLASVLKPEKF